MNRRDKALCQAAGCHSLAARAVEVDLPASWEATENYTTLTVVAGLCCKHGAEVHRRVEAVLEARSDLYNLITIVEAAVSVERDLSRRAERAIEAADRHELENGGLRKQLREAEAELRVRHGDHRQVSAAGGVA